jgi:hypothetical protein
MDRDEWEEVRICALCGASVWDADSPFRVGAEGALCPTCATALGGRYDPKRDVWDAAPDLTGLADGAHGAALGDQPSE